MKRTRKLPEVTRAGIWKGSKARCNACLQLDLLLRAIPELYPNDAIRPGLSLAILPEKECVDGATFYGSVSRYNKDDVLTRRPAFTVHASSVEELIEELATGLVTKTENVQKLQANIRRSTKR